MAEPIQKKQDKIEREYTIPLRRKYQHVPRYKKTPKAVKTIKEFLARHMKIYDKDLKKIKIDKYLNEYLWFRGIKKPPYKVKVKAIKENDIVKVSLIEMPNKLKFKKARADKQETAAKAAKEASKSAMEKAKEQLQAGKTTQKEPSEETKEAKEPAEKPVPEEKKKTSKKESLPKPEIEDKDKDGVDDKKEEKEKQDSVKDKETKKQKQASKKKTTKPKTPSKTRQEETTRNKSY